MYKPGRLEPERLYRWLAQPFGRNRAIAAWAEALKIAAHTKDIYGFFNNHFAGHSPANAREMQRLLGQEPVDPESLRGQRSLF